MTQAVPRTAIALVLLGLLAGGLWYWQRAQPVTEGKKAPSATARVPQVGVAKVVRQDMPVVLEASGTVVSLQSVEVRPQAAGTIEAVHVSEGQQVTRGQLLFTLDDRTARAERDRVRAQWQRDRVQLLDLERQERRSRELLAEQFVSPGALEAIQAQVQAQRALVQADEAAVRAADVAVSDARLKAPMSGRVGAIGVRPGSRVQVAGDALLVIRQMDPIGVGFSVPESALPSLLGAKGAGARVEVSLPNAVSSAETAGNASWVGGVHFVDSAVDSATGTVAVKGRLDNADQRLWAGQFVQVRLTLDTMRQVLVIPQSAVQLRGAERQVYVVDDKGVARLRTVRLLHADADRLAVEGLKEGERVIVEGRQQVRPDAPVKVAGAAPSAPAASAASGAP